MKIIRTLAGFILFAALIAGSLFALYHLFQPGETWNQLLELAKTKKLEAIIGALAVIFLSLVFILTGIRLPQKEQYLAYDIDGGSVSISLKAIEDFLAKLVDEFAAIISLQPTIKPVGGAISVQLDVRVKSGAHIPELCRMLQDRARESIKQNVGFSDIRDIRVRVQEIVMTPAVDTTATEPLAKTVE